MEPEQREDRHVPNPPEAASPESCGEQIALTLPFASEGLEGIRDSHC